MKYLIGYDIEDNRLRSKISTYLEGLGRRLQRSVFLTELSRFEIKSLKSNLVHMCEGKQVDIILVPLCQGCEGKIKYLGKEKRSFEII